MNRQQRRKADREKRRDASEYAAMIVKRDQAIRAAKAKLERNGITMEDVDKAGRDGYAQGYEVASCDTVLACYAAICLALKETHGFGKKRCAEVLRKVDDIILYRLTGQDLVNRVWDEMGLRLEFNAPFDRIEEGKE